MSKKPQYAWDTSVFVAWLTDQSDAPLADIAAVIQEIENDNAVLIVSTTTYGEILEIRHTTEQMDKFRGFLKRSSVCRLEVTQAVAEKAAEIRSRGLALRSPQMPNGKKIKLPDAQHMATAILLGADVLHSLDPDMLKLDGGPIVEGLSIKLPILLSGQRQIPYPPS